MDRVKQISPEFETLKVSVANLVQEKVGLENRIKELEETPVAPAENRTRFGSGNSMEDLRSRFYSNSLGSEHQLSVV